MTEVELRQAILDAIWEILAPKPRRALVLFTGGLLGFEDALASLQRLAAAGVELDYVQTPSATKILDQAKIETIGMRSVQSGLVANHDLLLAPTLTANIAAKASHGVADCLASNLFSEFIMTNRLVVASRTAICPDSPEKRSWFPQLPLAYAGLLRGNLAVLSSYGVRLADARVLARTTIAAFERRERAERADLVRLLQTSPAALLHAAKVRLGQAVPPAQPAGLVPLTTAVPARVPVPAAGSGSPDVIDCHRTLISQGVIQQLAEGCVLRIAAGAKVTAMAADLASARSIRIIQEV